MEKSYQYSTKYTNHFGITISFLSHNSCDICFLIEKQRLTDCLDLLEKAGYTSDTALFMLAYLQGGAV